MSFKNLYLWITIQTFLKERIYKPHENGNYLNIDENGNPLLNNHLDLT